MLQHLRDNSRGVISFILIGFLVIIFALTGVEALFNWDTSANQAAEVNGEPITEMDVARAINIQKQQMLNNYGDQIPPEFLSDEYLRKPVLDNLVQRKILFQTAKENGMTVGNEQLNEQIAGAPQFKNEAGAFDNNRYQQTLRNIGYTHGTYTRLLAEDVVINQLQSGITATAFTTAAQLDDIIALSFQSRDISYLILPSAKVRDSVTVADTEVQTYYDQNQPTFTSEEQIAVDYINLNVADLMKNVNVTEDQIRRQYEQNLASFVATPERQAAHILIEGNDENEIKIVSEKIASGTEFGVIAKEHSDDLGSKEQGGELGFTKGDAFPAEFEAALKNLKIGEVSPPVKTDAGTHFIKLLSEKGSVPPTFEEQKASVEEQLKRAEAENLFVAQLEKLRDLSYNAESLSEVATELGVQVKNSGLFERNKGTDLMANAKVVAAAFSPEVLQEGNSSDVIEIDSSNVVVLKKTDHKPAQVRPLAEVKEQILNILKDQKTKALLNEQGAKMLAELKAGATIKDVGATSSLEVKQVKAAKRSNADVDGDVLRHAFSMAKPANSPTFGSVLTASGDLAIIALESVAPGTLDAVTPEQKTAITAQLGNIYGQNDFLSFQSLLKDAADIN